MTKVLHCPQCKADKHSITILRTGTRYYTADLNSDGDIVVDTALDFVDDDFGETYHCESCHHDSEDVEDFIMEIE